MNSMSGLEGKEARNGIEWNDISTLLTENGSRDGFASKPYLYSNKGRITFQINPSKLFMFCNYVYLTKQARIEAILRYEEFSNLQHFVE
ncbi:hypothetical protein VNO77_33283 [Canavalia gladiata]|uniref:Uncharacterized protein n=1 Tax=Canavalia gladiata TaxID=3824 RepID=A0AAN9KBH3_CANGL